MKIALLALMLTSLLAPFGGKAHRKKGGVGPLTMGELVLLLLVALLGGGLVFGTYYVTRNGVPPFAGDPKDPLILALPAKSSCCGRWK